MSDLTDRLSKQEHRYQPVERTKTNDWLVEDVIYNVIDHNTIVAIYEDDKEDTHYGIRLWRGMAHSIPEQYRKRKFKRVFGSVAESIHDSDVVNIDVYWE